MIKKENKILFFSHESKLYGASRSLFYIVRDLSQKYDCEVVTFGSGPLVQNIEDINLNIIVIQPLILNSGSFYGKIFNVMSSRVKLLTNILRLIRVIRKNKPDLVYVNTTAKISPIIAAKLCGLSVIVHVREGDKYLFPKEIKKKLVVWLMIQLTDTFICVSQATKRNLELLRGIKKTIHVVYNGINPLEFQRNKDESENIHHKLNIPLDSITIGFVGRPTYLKGIDVLIKAITEFNDNDDIVFIIIGGSEDELNSCKLKIKLNGCLERVRLIPFQSNIKPYYSAFDIFVMPSLSEQFSRVLLEAASMECAIIATDVGGTCEALINNESAIIIPKDSSKDLITSIKILIKDYSYSRYLSSNAKKRVETFFTIKQSNKMIDKIINSYYFDTNKVKVAPKNEN